jgi:hypothetical protein
MIARVLVALAPASLGACFNFDATMAGGPLGDSGVPVSSDASLTDGTLPEPADANGPTLEAAAPDGSLDGGAGSYCASIARPDGGVFFCDDFDDHGSLGVWQSYDELGGTLLVTDASARSAPYSVDETTMPLDAGQPVNVALRNPEALPALPATLTFAFSLEPIQIDTNAGAAIVLAAVDFLDAAGDRYTVGLAINVVGGQPALALGEQSGTLTGGSFPDGAPPVFVNHPLPQTELLPMNAWTDVLIELDWTATALAAKVTLNGGSEFDTPLTLSLAPTSLQIGIGTSYVTSYEGGLSPVWELRYDNVLFTAR